MEKEHLSEDVLQAILLNEMTDETVRTHLSTCATCQDKMQEYQILVDTIGRLPNNSLDFDVTNLVMQQIEVVEQQRNKNQERVFWTVFALLTVLVLSGALPFLPKIATAFRSIPLLTNSFILVTGSFVFIYLVIDLFKQYKLKEEQLFEKNLQPKQSK